MHDIPECLSRRYQALDELIADLSLVVAMQGTKDQCSIEANDASIKLLCEFWNILKEDPDCNLTEEVRQRMVLDNTTSQRYRSQRLTCYMAEQDQSKPTDDEKKKTCCGHKEETVQPKPEEKSESKSGVCCNSKSVSPKSTNETLPLSKVLCNLKEAVSFDKKCNARIGELMKTQKLLQEQIQQLEDREREGSKLLKQAECMWSCMESAYKKKIKESLERQSGLLKQMKEIETSNTKWRKNKKDLEFQLGNVDKCCMEIKEKLQQKNNDVKCIKMEINDFKKRIANNTKQVEAAKKSFGNKKKASDSKIASLSAQMTKMKKVTEDEQNYKKEKESEGSKYLKEAREDLQKIYRLLLERKLENEDLRAEKQALLQELDLLRITCEQCKDKCQKKEKTIYDEIAKIDAEITGFKVRCIQCHECTDTSDARKFCTDCPRCAEERECLYKDGHCHSDVTMDCVCMSTKQKFMDNVLDNMYSVLEQQTKTPVGKNVADAVLDCLKKSRNGKLNENTRKILQDFVLTTVKKNLNLTIIGGAVKTRCEMDPETYNQLMLCLNLVKATPPPKVDKGTVSKKEPCTRWGDTSECNCPKGPKSCICTKKGLPEPNDLETCPTKDNQDAGEKTLCPHKESAPCGADCAMRSVPSAVGKEVAAWRPDPCNDKKCTFSKNMRAAQCVLGPDSLMTASKIKGFKTKVPHIPDVSVLENQIICNCGPTPTKPCACRTEIKSNSRERIIEEVMGRYTDVTPIQRVTTLDENLCTDLNKRENKNRYVSSNLVIKEALQLSMSEFRSSSPSAYSESYTVGDITHCKETRENNMSNIHSKGKNECTFLKKGNNNIFPTCQCSKKVIYYLKKRNKASITGPMLTIRSVDKAVGSDYYLLSSHRSIGILVESNSLHKSEHSIADKSNQNSGSNILGRHIGVTMKQLIKTDILKTSKKYDPGRPSTQWITAESLLKAISSLTRSDNKSSDINENEIEIEINNELLSAYNNNLTHKTTQRNLLLHHQYECEKEPSAVINNKIKTTINCVYMSDSFEYSSRNSTEKSCLASDVTFE